MKDEINDLLDFTLFTNEIRKIKRSLLVISEEVYENDSEHSYQLALIAYYIIETKSLKLDIFKSMSLAMVHDIVEVYAGDTPVFGDDIDLVAKEEKEKKAVFELKKQWPNLVLMHQLIAEFEERKTPESKFIYALDKLVPILNNYLDDGRNWKVQNVSLDQIIKAKTKKINIDSTINYYYEQIICVLRDKPGLFLSGL